MPYLNGFAVLLKPGKLTEEEFATMKQHATIGACLRFSPLEANLSWPSRAFIAPRAQAGGSGHVLGQVVLEKMAQPWRARSSSFCSVGSGPSKQPCGRRFV